MSRPAVSAVGRTSIEELFSLLKRCSLLVTNDTGTMHFAAAGGVPSLMLCIGPAFFRGTGPYSSGNLALQAELPCAPCRYTFNCPDPLCREIIGVDAVYNVCRATLQGNRPGREAGVKIYQSFFGGDGYLDWQRCDGCDEGDEAMGERYARMWKSCLDDGGSVPQNSRPSTDDAPELVRLAERGMTIASEIAEASRATRPPLERLKALGDAESSVVEQIKLSGVLQPEYAPLVDFFSHMRDNITSEELTAIAEDTHRCYAWSRHLASSL
jgi:hypothetical protein